LTVRRDPVKQMIAWALTVGLAGPLAAEEKAGEAVIKEMLKDSETLVEILKTVKDVKSAKEAGPKLEKAYAEMQKKARELNRLPTEQRRALQAKNLKAFERTRDAFRAERQRLARDKEVMAVLAKLSPFREMSEARRQKARAEVQTLTKTAQIYRIRNGKYPEKLQDLAGKQPEGSPPIVEKRTLNDSWGRPYQYDPRGPKNGGKRPDIWSLGLPNRKGELIGNWPEKKPGGK
jgi:hypothetical protein